jgi:predicted  nucleic acid-binding Zn-ribbon protein
MFVHFLKMFVHFVYTFETIKLREVKDERAYFRRREMDIEQTFTKTEAELARKQKDLEEIRSKIKSRQENSPAVYNYLTGMYEAIRSECRALEEKVKATNCDVY